jgi:hypothetical protein
MGDIEFIGLITHGGQALDHFGLTNTDTPIWRDQNWLSELTPSARLQQLDSPYWTGSISLLILVGPYWSNQFAGHYSAKSLRLKDYYGRTGQIRRVVTNYDN